MADVDIQVELVAAPEIQVELASPIDINAELASPIELNVDVVARGPRGPVGDTGAAGAGVAAGGTTGQVLAKASATDYDTEWVDAASGGGAVDSVNSQTGAVILDADDIDDASTTHKFVTASDLTTLSNTSGTNTGDQDLSNYATTAAVAAGYQPLDADLTALAALTSPATKLSGIEANADVTDAASVDAAGAVMNSDTSTTSMSFVIDEDDMTSNLNTKVPTQQSVKAYVDNELIAAGGYNDEAAQDAVGTILTDSSEIDFTYDDATPSITASIVAGSIDETKLDTSVNASLDLADSALQSGDIANFETTTQLNSRDTANRDRANHTGSQAISTVTNLQTTLDGKVAKDELVFNVMDYGAVADGTTDDSYAIQDAIDAAISAGGGTVYLPDGTYGLDGYKGAQASYNASRRGGLYISSGVKIVGASRERTIIKNIVDNSVSGISIRGGSGIELRNFTLDMDFPNKTAIALATSSVRGEGIIFHGEITPIEDLVIDNICVQNTGHYGIGMQNITVNRALITGCYGKNIGGDFIDIKEYTTQAKDSIIIDNCEADTVGLNATALNGSEDAAAFDLRGDVVASNLRVINLDSYTNSDSNPMIGACGIRINGDLASDSRIGGRNVVVKGAKIVSAKLDSEGSASAKRIIGVRIGASNSVVSDVIVENCYTGFWIEDTGDNIPTQNQINGCVAVNCQSAAGTTGTGLVFGTDCDNNNVNMSVIDSEVGVTCNSTRNVGRIILSGNTKDHNLTADVLRQNTFSFYSESTLTADISRATLNNYSGGMTLWGKTQPALSLRSTFDGTWTSPYDDGVLKFEAEDASGGGAAVRAEVRARHSGASGGATRLIMKSHDGTSLNDVAAFSNQAGDIGGAWVDWTPSTTGWSSPTITTAKYTQVGKTVTVCIGIDGTSNATTKTFTLPVASLYQVQLCTPRVRNNGSVLNTPGLLALGTGSTTVSAFISPNASAWTASSTATIYPVTFSYEVA